MSAAAINDLELERVTRTDRCTICNHGDWCSRSADGTFVICMRTASDHQTKNGGWLHWLKRSEQRRRYRGIRVRAIKLNINPIDFEERMRDYQRAVHPILLSEYAADLGLTPEALMQIGIGRAFDGGRQAADAGDVMRGGAGWALPMFDAHMKVIGIKIRFASGEKRSIAGSREGVFVPCDLSGGSEIVIAEGPTDTAALLDLGFNAFGRPNCTGGVPLVLDLINVRRPKTAVICADNDLPGHHGAEVLARQLALWVPTVRVITPPCGIKDARAWKRAGATSADIRAAIEAAPIRRLKLSSIRCSVEAIR
jgi:hypothetical protein